MPGRFARWQPSTTQLEALRHVFESGIVSPDPVIAQQIAMEIGTTRRRVVVWFQNQRQRRRVTATTKAKKTSPPQKAPECLQYVVDTDDWALLLCDLLRQPSVTDEQLSSVAVLLGVSTYEVYAAFYEAQCLLYSTTVINSPLPLSSSAYTR